MNGWVGIDLDGTLAEYEGWQGIEHIGEPIEWARTLVLELIDRGVEVRIVTARVQEGPIAVAFVNGWTKHWFGTMLPVTDKKDMNMVMLIDDRAYGPKTWHQIPFPWEIEAMCNWHNSPSNPDAPKEIHDDV